MQNSNLCTCRPTFPRQEGLMIRFENKIRKINLKKVFTPPQLAQLLPMEENFLLLFRFDNPLDSSVEFMKLWCLH